MTPSVSHAASVPGYPNLRPNRLGRPRGQFTAHKLAVFKFLHQNGPVFVGNNDELAVAVGEWGVNNRFGVGGKQMSRYLKQLEAEGRIKITISRGKSSTGFFTHRTITVLSSSF